MGAPTINNGDKIAEFGLAQAYQPIIRGYFTVAALYYAIMAVSYFLTLGGQALFYLSSAAITACIVSLSALRYIRKLRSVRRLEIIISLVNALILINVMVALNVEYSPVKLDYFIIMAMIFAFASVSMRQALIAIIASLSALFYMISERESDQILIYSFVGFAAALCAFAIAFYLRRAIGLAISARHVAEDRLETAQQLGETMRQQSLTDSLTGLPNRRAFFEVMENSQNTSGPSSNQWLMLLDLDGFKAVNDHYGHITGDELLKAVSIRLQSFCGPQNHVSRMGGDEFNIILSCNNDDKQLEPWCQDLLACLAEVYLIEDRLIQISGSIGCYQISEHEPHIKQIQKADYALLHAKRSGKNRVVVFREELAKEAAERFVIEQALRIADFDAEIVLFFQPQHDLSTNKTVCVEALARWISPSLGPISPGRFIETAEECGLISRITLCVLDKALAAIQYWENQITVSINLSGHDLISDQIIDQIIELVKVSGVSPSLIEFEVTETAMMTDTGKASANLYRLAEIGHPLSLDDFGTGYSNFSYLRSLPISKLKVDRSFMENLGDPMTEKILRSLVGMARTLEVHCLLEGIENELELMLAKRVGAQSVQGYLFGRPMPALALQRQIYKNDNAVGLDVEMDSAKPTRRAKSGFTESKVPQSALRKKA